jgi:hypothetical protein
MTTNVHTDKVVVIDEHKRLRVIFDVAAVIVAVCG